MLVLLAPAKTMDATSPVVVPFTTPSRYIDEANRIAWSMADYSVDELGGMLRVNRALATLTKERYMNFHSPDTPALPALLAYTGIVFRCMNPVDFSTDDFAYAQDHLRIASACYGLSRPLDEVKPYRMEYDVVLPSIGMPVADYWKTRLTDTLIADVQAAGGVLMNLASREIQLSLDWAKINAEVRVVTPEFKVFKGSGLKTIVIYAKMMRGLMTRHVLKNRLTHPDEILSFASEGFHYSPAHSTPGNPVFVM